MRGIAGRRTLSATLQPHLRRLALTLVSLVGAAPPVVAQTTGGTATSHLPAPHFASGTSWEPASAGSHGVHLHPGGWTIVLHGQGTLAYAADPDPHGDRDLYGTSVVGLRGSRRVAAGTLEVRAMASADPTLGSDGYPLLLQTGETADGFRPLYDRQHPHDLFVEIAALYRVRPAGGVAPFIYLAPIGEPAFGPPAFMHRASGRDIPNAPIGHHFHDGTHVTYGVVTLGVTIRERAKLEVSAFRGREPDEHHWNIERPRLDSYAARVTVLAGTRWALQASVADVDEPEQIHPGLDVRKATASVTHHRAIGSGSWSTTAAFGANRWSERTVTVAGIDFVVPARTQVALLLESSLRAGRWSAFTRFEAAEKDELRSLRHQAQ